MNPNINNNNEVLAFYNSVKFRLENGDMIQNAINLAYGDLKRTIRGFSKCEKKEQIKGKVSSFIKCSYEELINISDTYKKYDTWHEYVCKRIVAIFIEDAIPEIGALTLSSQFIKENCSSPKVYLTIGQAQKWVNMFMKYMYLCDERMEELLPYLHIPIDNIILDGIEKHSSYFPLKKYFHYFCPWSKSIYSLRPWSKLNDYSLYLEFQKEFRHIFPNPLIHEFYLWNKWKAKNFKQFEELTDFIEYFSNTKQDFYFMPPPIHTEEMMLDGKKVEVHKCVHPQYIEKCEKFFQIFIDRYHVYNYKIILYRKGVVKFQDIENTDFESQDAFTVLTFFTAIILTAYFEDDTIFGKLANKGIIYKMLLRLQNIDNNV